MKTCIRLLVVAAALARGVSAEPCHEIGSDPAPLTLASASDFSIASALAPEATPEPTRMRQPGAVADFGASVAAPALMAPRLMNPGNLESDHLLGFFSPTDVGGLFYVVVIVLGFYYRWLFRRTRERPLFVTQRMPVWEPAQHARAA